MTALIDKLKTMADIILFDSPPLLAVADSALLARVCDATLMVVQAETTRGDVLRRAKEQLDQSGAKLVGVVINRVSNSRDGYYYNYRHYYSNEE
jgi:non-specific protein-tyrosine kinase